MSSHKAVPLLGVDSAYEAMFVAATRSGRRIYTRSKQMIEVKL